MYAAALSVFEPLLLFFTVSELMFVTRPVGKPLIVHLIRTVY